MKTKSFFLTTLFILCVSCSSTDIESAPITISPGVDLITTQTPPVIPTYIPTLPNTLTPQYTPAHPKTTPNSSLSLIDLSAADNEVYQKALSDIPLYRQGEIQINLQDRDGNPLPGFIVKYHQASHDFLFGGNADPYYASKLKEAGINTMTIYMAWNWFQPEHGDFSLDFANYWLGIDELKNGNMRVKTNGLYMVNAEDMPPYYLNLSFEEFLGRLYEHEATIVKRFGPSVDYWEAILEPNFGNHNPLSLSKDEYYQAINTSIQAIRDNDPDAIVEINLSYPCGGINWLDNIQIVQEMLDRNIDFDVLGLQFYYNAFIGAGNYQMPMLSFSEMSSCYDKYEELLSPQGKKIVGSEFSVPSESPPGQIGYWGIPWSDDTQAQYLATAYTILFSKPSNQGLIWWNTVEPSPFVYNGGLIRDDGTFKKSYYTLQQLIDSWTTSGEGTTDSSGNITFRGFGGDYDVEIINPANGESMVAQVHITEQNSTSETIIISPNNIIEEKLAALEELVDYWDSESDQIKFQEGTDYLSLVKYHLSKSEWEQAKQTLLAALDDLEIQIETIIPINKLIPVGYRYGMDLENGSAPMWGATTLQIPFDFPEGSVTVEIMAHSQNEKGESPLMVSGIGANYSPVWKVDASTYEIYEYTINTTGNEEVFTIRFPYDGRIYDRITAQNGDVGELKLYIDQVRLFIRTTAIP